MTNNKIDWSTLNYTTATPTVSGLTVGTGGSLSYKHKILGDTVFFVFQAKLGTSGFSVGDVNITPPVAISSTAYITDRVVLGSGALYDSSAGSGGVFFGWAHLSLGNLRLMCNFDASRYGALSSTGPFTWAAGDQIFVAGSYIKQ